MVHYKHIKILLPPRSRRGRNDGLSFFVLAHYAARYRDRIVVRPSGPIPQGVPQIRLIFPPARPHIEQKHYHPCC